MAIDNLVYTEVAGTPYADNVTTIDVDSGAVFPAVPFEATVFNFRKNPGKAFNEGEAMIINVSNVTTNTLTFTPVTTQIALSDAIDWAVIVGVTKAVLDGKEPADATILKEADIVNDLTTGGAEVPSSAETVKTLNTLKMEGSFKQFYDASNFQYTNDFVVDDDIISITDLTVGRTYEIDFFSSVFSGSEVDYFIELAVRHDSINYKNGVGHNTRPTGRYTEGVVRTRHTFIATATTASIRCVGASPQSTDLYMSQRNLIIREHINMPESTSMGITSI